MFQYEIARINKIFKEFWKTIYYELLLLNNKQIKTLVRMSAKLTIVK